MPMLAAEPDQTLSAAAWSARPRENDSCHGCGSRWLTTRQPSSDGIPFPTLLARCGIIPGIKVDLGAKPLAGRPGEKITEGLDGLRDRLADWADRVAGRATRNVLGISVSRKRFATVCQ